MDTMEYLGFILLPNGLQMDPAKVSAIMEWPELQKVKDVQAFLGFANFYQRFILLKYSMLYRLKMDFQI